ncbi:hypothetical protein [Nitrosomonas sp. ANs5]
MSALLNLARNFCLGWYDEGVFSLYERAPPWPRQTVNRQPG